MKFKSTIIDIPTFSRISQSLALLSKQGWLRLTPSSVQFIVQPPGGTQVWATIENESMFSSFQIESNAGNLINLELNLDSLGRLLRSIVECGQVVMKLTRRDKFPMLSFVTQYFGKQGGSNSITHDLHVRVLSEQAMAQVTEPTIPDPDVVIMVPALSQLSQISTSLKSLSDRVILSANMDGEFKIGITTPAVSTFTAFRDLLNPGLEPIDGQDTDNHPHPTQTRDKTQFCRLKVDAKDWCNLLRIGSIAKRVVACFCEAHALILYVYVTAESDEHNSVLTYYIATYQD